MEHSQNTFTKKTGVIDSTANRAVGLLAGEGKQERIKYFNDKCCSVV